MAYGGRSETRITERPLPNMQRPTADPPRPDDLNRRSYAHMAAMKDTVWYAWAASNPTMIAGEWWATVLIADETVGAQLTAATRSVKKGDKVGVSNTGGHWTVVENYTPPPPVPVVAPPTGTIPPVSGSTTVPTKNPTPYTPRALDVPTRILREPEGHDASGWPLSVNRAIADLRSSMYDVYDALRNVEREQRKIQDAIADLSDLTRGTRDAAASIDGRVTNAQSAISTATSLVNGTRESVKQMHIALGPDGERIVK